MRLTSLRCQEGKQRYTRKFLLWPRSFDDDETRWLEYAWVIERVCKIDVGAGDEWGKFTWKWCEVGFLNPVEH